MNIANIWVNTDNRERGGLQFFCCLYEVTSLSENGGGLSAGGLCLRSVCESQEGASEIFLVNLHFKIGDCCETDIRRSSVF